MDSVQNTGHAPTHYQHLETDKQQFRTLILHSGSGSDRIQARLETASFDNPPVYETISYCWGNDVQTSTIELNGGSIIVPASSAAALAQMRLPSKDRTLWIDAICINQREAAERAQQVQMMGLIYSKSTGNLIFLGEGDDSTASALNSLQNIYADLVEETDDFQQLDGTMLKTGTGPLNTVAELKCEIEVPALKTFFSLLWFRRLWVFQEFALAPLNTCLVGSFSFSFLLLTRTATWILGSKKIDNELDSLMRQTNCITAFYFADPLGPCAAGAVPGMENLLAACLYLRATDPRDYVYGMLGIHQRETESVHPLLIPDYLRPVNDVFRDATRYLLEVRKHHRVWLWVHRDDDAELQSSDRPFWAIDWSHLRAAKSLSLHLKDANAGCEGAIAPALRFPEADEDVVFVKGLPLADVVDTTSTLRVGGEMAWLEECFEKVHANRSAEETEQPLSAILTAFDHGRELPSTQRVRAFAEFSRSLPFCHPLSSTSPPAPDQDDAAALALKFERAWIRTCSGQKAFTTSDGCVGIGPPVVNRGDRVVIFRGFHVPYLLRPTGMGRREFKVVGACYASGGVMDGDAMRQHLAAGEEDEVFWIR